MINIYIERESVVDLAPVPSCSQHAVAEGPHGTPYCIAPRGLLGPGRKGGPTKGVNLKKKRRTSGMKYVVN